MSKNNEINKNQEATVRSRLQKCLQSQIAEIVMREGYALFAVPSISAAEIMSIAKQFMISPADVGISMYKPDALMVFFEVPKDGANKLEAVVPISQFVCDICQQAVTDTTFKTNQDVYSTERRLYCSKCWNETPKDEKVLRVYIKGEEIDDIPREIKLLSLVPWNEEELR